jgi:hypothetical protein
MSMYVLCTSLEMLAARVSRVGGQRLAIDQIHLRSPAAEIEQIQTPCGKLCQMLEWTEGLTLQVTQRRCPSCMSRLPKHITKVPSFETVQRGVGYPTSLDDKDATHR